MTSILRSWVQSANKATTDFPLNNLPYGVFSQSDQEKRCGVAIGDKVFDCKSAQEQDLLAFDGLFDQPGWNAVMAAGPDVWRDLRDKLTEILGEGSDQSIAEKCLVDQSAVTMHMPFDVVEFTDFYAGKHHATNVGTMFRGAENALPPNWLHIPIGYNGRASSVVVSGTDIQRPWGQLKGPNDEAPRFAPCARFDLELELGAIIGQPSSDHVTVDEANDMIFGYVLLNDWSARDIQAWEYQPLGPFQSKATATSISPWIVTRAALEPFATPAPKREKDLLPHLKDTGPMLYDIQLAVDLAPNGKEATRIAETNYSQMYYSSAQQLAHHTTSGCPMRVGDLIGSGTVSGPEKSQFGSLLELSWGGKEPIKLDTGEQRSFLEDGDELTLRGFAEAKDYRVGFGSCSGKILAAKTS